MIEQFGKKGRKPDINRHSRQVKIGSHSGVPNAADVGGLINEPGISNKLAVYRMANIPVMLQVACALAALAHPRNDLM